MKLLLLSVLLISACTVRAQTPVTSPDTVDPVQQGDPAVRYLPRTDYVDSRQQIDFENLPKAVREAVASELAPKELDSARIFHERLTNEYVVESIRRGEKESYRYDVEGKPVQRE